MDDNLIKAYLAEFQDALDAHFTAFERKIESQMRDLNRRLTFVEKHNTLHDPTGILHMMPDFQPETNEQGAPLGPKSPGTGTYIRNEPEGMRNDD